MSAPALKAPHAFLLACALAAFTGCSDTFVGPANLSPEGAQAFRGLLRTETFAGPEVGFGGLPSAEVEAFRVLLHEEAGAEAFDTLLRRAHKAGQLYGLAGLYFLDRAKMEAAKGRYLRDENEVETIFGCLIERARVSVLAEQIVSGALPEYFRGRQP